MIGVAGTDVYWMRLGPLELGPLLQAHIHVRVCVEDVFRAVYVGHEFLRRPNPKANWEAGELVRVPLDEATRSQILVMILGELWSLLMSGLNVESLADLEWAATENVSSPALLTAPLTVPLEAQDD